MESSARAAAEITASITRELKGVYAGKAMPTINVHVGDITLIGFDEAIDAEEWGMRETNVEAGGAQAGAATLEGAAKLYKAKHGHEGAHVSRKLDLKKGSVVIVMSEESTPVQPEGQASQPSARPTTPATVRP
jgi:hypothetical protein